MIDLRSDTLSMPTKEMLESITIDKLGDAGRLDSYGRGEDRAVNELEDYSSNLLKKDRALFFSSGTLANNAALLTHCNAGDKVLIDEIIHIYKSEKFTFTSKGGNLTPLFYKLDENGTPSIESLREQLENNNVKLLIIENSHNFAGGTCITLEKLKDISDVAKAYNVKIHMDGARLFNAAESLNVKPWEIVKYVDSVMFCLSKGLGAPMGSLLLGDFKFIQKATEVKKMLGGNMRQAGVIASPGLYALKNNLKFLREDNENAKLFSKLLDNIKNVRVQKNVETNIVMLDVKDSGLSAEEYCSRLREKGLLIRPVLENKVRLVFYKDISREETEKAAKIILELDDEL
ncbi:threonine aldolase family protein [Anaerosphaera multitolerans]|uniref:Aminotransferase class I/II-fold pyridoxal phosphate-dependent enzyme n=1 Tax=Anaerosphaera multitolerans TaxID=2487351 RepID=A0A437S632_9FIRM|nr:GntG family PLP-dependent aldolase [Anaerosphaera multitolerans]RVU54493.1 aminotransferase class I/II-fold pyridoxal phosphate-dependent enzyme [Anaerosphaera multitolerans]